MKAYITTQVVYGRGYSADVVSAQDYHERGPFARSYRSPNLPTRAAARADAAKWAKQNGLTIVNGPDNF